MFNFFNRRLMQRLLEAEKAVEIANKRATLIGIKRTGRMNTFTFVRGDRVINIETMGLLSDDVAEWKEKLL